MSLYPCPNCRDGCTHDIGDRCVEYTGPSITCDHVDIPKSSNKEVIYYDQAFVAVAKGLCEYIENNKVDLSCLYDGCDERTVELKIAVEKLIDAHCTLDTDDVKSNAGLFCLGGNASVCSANLIGQPLKISSTNLKEGVKFTYDFTDTIANLPANYEVSDVRVRVSGQSTGTVDTIISEMTSPSGGVTIELDRYPATADCSLTLNTPCGQIELYKKIALNSSSQGGFTPTLDINDYSSNEALGALSLSKYLEIVAANVCHNKNAIDNLKYIEVSGCSQMSYPFRDIHTVIQVIDGKLCEALSRLDSIGEETVQYKQCNDNCNVNIQSDSLQNVLFSYGDRICDLLDRVITLEAQVQELTLKVEKCCSEDSSSSSTAGSSSGGSSCSGGSCNPSGSTTGDSGNFNSGSGFGGGGTITGNPNGGNGDGNGNPQTCTDSPVSIEWSYNCITGIEYTVSGAVGGFTVTLNGESIVNGATFDDGVYVLRVVDGRDCSSSASITIDCCDVDFTPSYDCTSGLTVTVSGGSGNNTITVDGATYTQGMTLTDGSHTAVVMDNTQNCSVSKIVNVDCEADPAPCDGVVISTSSSSGDYCNDNSLDVTFSGGTGPYSISVSGSQLASGVTSSPYKVYPSGLSNESVVVTVTDTNGCTGSSSVFVPSCVSCTVTVGAPIAGAFSCDAGSHILNFTVARPIGEYTVTITDRDTSTVVTTLVGQTGSNSFSENLGVGTSTSYLVEVADSEGCTASTVIDVTPC